MKRKGLFGFVAIITAVSIVIRRRYYKTERAAAGQPDQPKKRSVEVLSPDVMYHQYGQPKD